MARGKLGQPVCLAPPLDDRGQMSWCKCRGGDPATDDADDDQPVQQIADTPVDAARLAGTPQDGAMQPPTGSPATGDSSSHAPLRPPAEAACGGAPAPASAQERDFKVGDKVEVRDRESDAWKLGLVTDTDPLLKVRLSGWKVAVAWKFVRRRATIDKTPP